MKALLPIAPILSVLLLTAGCAPEVGSERWCKQLEEKPKGDWSMNEAGDYAKHCIFRQQE